MGKQTTTRKMFFTPEEKKGILLGTIASSKKTETYKTAKKYFEKTTERLKNENYMLQSDTQMWVNEDEGVIYMSFVVILDSTNPEIKKKIKQDYEKSKKMFEEKLKETFDDVFKGELFNIFN